MTSVFEMDEEEVRARLLCKLLGLDPDARVSRAHPKGYAVHLEEPRWWAMQREISLFRRTSVVVNMSRAGCIMQLHEILQEEAADKRDALSEEILEHEKGGHWRG